MSAAPPVNPQGITSTQTSGWRVLLKQRELVVGLVVIALALFLTLASDIGKLNNEIWYTGCT